jgi:hypothetical protein
LLVLTFLVAPSVYADKDKDRREWEKERREAYREAQKEHREAMKARRRHGGYLDDRYDRDRRFEDSRNSARRMGVSQGYRDGYEKGQEDYRKNRTADLYRHERYRDADHGYKGKYGDKTSYEQGYRQGFENGYDEGFIRFVRNRY